LHVSLSAETVAKLDWRESTTLTLLVGSAEAEGRIALKPKSRGPIGVRLNKSRGGGKPSGRIYVGHFDQLVPGDRKSEEPMVEQKNDQLILTLPEGWLKSS